MTGCAGGDREENNAAAGGGNSGLSQAPAPEASDPATEGEEVFQSKGCVACHRIGSRLVGPDLANVADRRTREWIVAMITSPDSMVRADETARALLAEYSVPMPNARVTPEEAGQIFEYLVRESGK